MPDEVRTILRKIKRLGLTVNGNPFYLLDTDAGLFRTKPDAMCNFAIVDGWADEQALLRLNDAGHVIYVEVFK